MIPKIKNVKNREGIHIGAYTHVPPATIVMIQAELNYSLVYLKDGTSIIVSICLKKLENRFAAFHSFARIHKSYLVNLDYFKSYHKGRLLLENDLTCVISRRKLKRFRKMPFAQNKAT